MEMKEIYDCQEILMSTGELQTEKEKECDKLFKDPRTRELIVEEEERLKNMKDNLEEDIGKNLCWLDNEKKAIKFSSKEDYKVIEIITRPNKTQNLPKIEQKIAQDIFVKINNLIDGAQKAGKEVYPFKYMPENNEYCFLISKGYLRNSNDLKDNTLHEIYKNKCAELQKHDFSFEDQILVTKHLKDISEEKRDDILKAHEILNNPKGHSDSELDDSLECVRGLSDEC